MSFKKNKTTWFKTKNLNQCHQNLLKWMRNDMCIQTIWCRIASVNCCISVRMGLLEKGESKCEVWLVTSLDMWRGFACHTRTRAFLFYCRYIICGHLWLKHFVQKVEANRSIPECQLPQVEQHLQDQTIWGIWTGQKKKSPWWYNSHCQNHETQLTGACHYLYMYLRAPTLWQ